MAISEVDERKVKLIKEMKERGVRVSGTMSESEAVETAVEWLRHEADMDELCHVLCQIFGADLTYDPGADLIVMEATMDYMGGFDEVLSKEGE